MKNILVYLKYLNSIKLKFIQFDRIWPNFQRHNICWIQSGSTRPNLAKIMTDPTRLNFAQFRPGPTLSRLAKFSRGRLKKNRPNFDQVGLDQIFIGADSTKYCQILWCNQFDWIFYGVIWAEFWSTLTRSNSAGADLNKFCKISPGLIQMTLVEFQTWSSRPNLSEFLFGPIR